MHEDDLLPISALQHLLFCQRQCALIHVERLWAENRLTVEGQHLHKKAHTARSEWKENTFVARGLRVRSFRLGLWGQADVVEFMPPVGEEWQKPDVGRQMFDMGTSSEMIRDEFLTTFNPRSANSNLQSSLDRWAGWTVVPIEYKRGWPKQNDSDRVQLCAQAMCLEEMLGVTIPAGALFYGKRRRRTEVRFDAALRGSTEAAAARLMEMVTNRETPRAVREPKCESCSLVELCLPDAMTPQSASSFVAAEFGRSLRSAGPTTDEILLPESS